MMHQSCVVASSKMDLVSGLVAKLQRSQSQAAGFYSLQTAVLLETDLHPQNRHAMALLRTWMASPDEKGSEWWDDFEQQLREHRLSFREAV